LPEIINTAKVKKNIAGCSEIQISKAILWDTSAKNLCMKKHEIRNTGQETRK
jgi:hypothetical protein